MYKANVQLLKQVLKELDIPLAIKRYSDRQLIQAAIYLAQVGGVDLGYAFGWRMHKPFCADLFHDLSEDITKSISDDFCLIPELRQKLERIKPLLVVPLYVRINRKDWADLLLITDFLRRKSKFDRTNIEKILKDNYEFLLPYMDKALKCLNKYLSI